MLHFDAMDLGNAVYELREIGIADQENFVDDQQVVLELGAVGFGDGQIVDGNASILDQSGAADADVEMWKAFGQSLLGVAADLVVHAGEEKGADRDRHHHRQEGG